MSVRACHDVDHQHDQIARLALLVNALSGHVGATAPLHDDQQHGRRDAGERFHANSAARARLRGAAPFRPLQASAEHQLSARISRQSSTGTGGLAQLHPGMENSRQFCQDATWSRSDAVVRVPSSMSVRRRRMILPDDVIGTCVVNWIARGTLYAARCCRQ
jgi:hypothetical protein